MYNEASVIMRESSIGSNPEVEPIVQRNNDGTENDPDQVNDQNHFVVDLEKDQNLQQNINKIPDQEKPGLDVTKYDNNAVTDRNITELKKQISEYVSSTETINVSAIPGSGTKDYFIEGRRVGLDWKTYRADESIVSHEKLLDEQKCIILVSGWGSSGQAKTMQNLAQELANQSQKDGVGRTFLIDSKAEKIDDNYLDTEAEAMRKFAEDSGIKIVILVGHSRGTIKLVDLAAALQDKNPDIKIEGLILFGPVGIYKQSIIGITAKFILDGPIEYLKNIFSKKPSHKDPEKHERRQRETSERLVDAGASIYDQVKASFERFGAGYFPVFKNEIEALTVPNEHCKEIKAPVVVVSGQADEVSDPERIVNEGKRNLGLQTSAKLEKDEALEGVFPASVYRKMITPKDRAGHGLSLLRPEDAAAAGLYVLRRYWRNATKEAFEYSKHDRENKSVELS